MGICFITPLVPFAERQLINMIENREEIEWLNYWIEEANQEKNRICLIGDSTTRQYRKIMNRILQSEGYVVDLIAMSYSMLDDKLTEELVHYFEGIGYQYKYIVLHIGTHHGFWFQCKTDKIYFERYKKQLETLCNLLSNYCDSIITVGGTPENEQMSKFNEEILVRNDILQEVSEEKGYPFLDFYQIMNNTNYKYVDICHYAQIANEYMANRVIETIFGGKRNEILNMKDTLNELVSTMDDAIKVFIYGDGERGKMVEQYLRSNNRNFDGYIVSKQYYRGQENTYQLEDVMDMEKVIIVTTGDYAVYQKLWNCGMNYICLSDNLYVYLEEYTSCM